MLADANLIDRLSERVWSAVELLWSAEVDAQRADEADTLAALAQPSAAPQAPLVPREQRQHQQQQGARRSLTLSPR